MHQGLKYCGEQLFNVRHEPSPFSRTVKRSRKRACRRAQKLGQVACKGHILKADPMQVPIAQEGRMEPSSGPCTSPIPSGLHVFCYNAGGLGGGLYEELLHFLHSPHYTVALTQETKGGRDSEFTTPHWVCLGSVVKASPILMISCQEESLDFQ